MGRLTGFRYREIVRRLKQLGFEFDRQAAGSHEIWFNPETHRYTTLPNHPGDMPEGTLRAILRQADIEPEMFLKKLGLDFEFDHSPNGTNLSAKIPDAARINTHSTTSEKREEFRPFPFKGKARMRMGHFATFTPSPPQPSP